MKTYKFILLALFILISDQVSKYLILKYIDPNDSIVIIPNFFNLVLTFNKGVAFGLMSNLSDALRLGIISATALMALGLLLWLYVTSYKVSFWHSFATALILGGAAGNIIDRIVQGSVTDFLDFYYKTWHWPAFNVSDSAICVGVALLIVIPDRYFQSSAES